MADKPKERPKLSDHGIAAAARRQRREAEALRANLARRKGQAREREGVSEGGDGAQDATKPEISGRA